MSTVDEIEQGSARWHAMRCGRVTGSRISDVTAKTKSGTAASRANYMAELVIERLTGQQADGFFSEDMKWGKEKEADAVAAYEFYRDVTTEKMAFANHPTIEMAGASPDRLVGADGLIELKCPRSSTHLETLLGGSIPGKYILQIQWQLACTKRQWCDFVSFDPRMPENLRLYVKRVDRDAALIVKVEREVREFLAELDETVASINKMYPQT